MFARRLSKELKDLAMNAPAGVNIIDANDFKVWKLGLAGAPGTLYDVMVHIYAADRRQWNMSL
ncbi:hypothetical protein BGZ97_004660 [Linnemannia gamsii]|uniref:Uncharacterized protein n=1 Tax=Linnemannia gamsii TaxID=64522 RepID=A0A9P6QU21_9FUNG|nr:hypothetical protein BGZ97_004660 [Linnemannia gamsii]